MKGVPVVDAVVAYDCSYTHKTYLLLGKGCIVHTYHDISTSAIFYSLESGY